MSVDVPPKRGIGAPLAALLAWWSLSLCVTARPPLEAGSLLSSLLPSADVALVLLLLSFLAWAGVGLQARAVTLLTAACLLTRTYLIADAIALHYWRRPFHLLSDLPLLPEFVRLLHSVGGALGVASCALGLGLGLCLLWFAIRFSWWTAWRALLSRSARRTLVALCALLALGSFSTSRAGARTSLYAAPVTPHVLAELRDLLRASGLYDDGAIVLRRDALAERVAATRKLLARLPPAPAPRKGPDLYLILVEAYGHCAFAVPGYAARIQPRWLEAEQRLRAGGFDVCSSFLTAPTFGGGSWYTHATLETGVYVPDQLEYETLLDQPRVPTLARMFSHAGYRSISVKPGTTRASPKTKFYGFDVEHTASSLGYAGPRYAWAPMPDQYVLHAVYEREIQQREPPLFLEYALVSSHYPFAPLPRLLADWSRLGNGAIFARTAPAPAPPPDAAIEPVAAAYLASIEYDLDAVVDYLLHFVHRPTLVLLMGDHQPTAGVTGQDLNLSVPLHAIANDPSLLDTWRETGCSPGLIPTQPGPHRGIETLLPQIAADFGLSLTEGP